jgi:hypothetical protein
MKRRSVRKAWLAGAVTGVIALILLVFLDFSGFLFLWLPAVPVPPPIPPPVFTDSCDPGGASARLALADPATRIALPWAGVTRATLSDSHNEVFEPRCSGTQVEIDYISMDLHSTFLQLCSEVRKRGWTDDPNSNHTGPVYSGDPIQETCGFHKTIAGRQALVSVNRFVNDGYTGPSVVLLLSGPYDPSTGQPFGTFFEHSAYRENRSEPFSKNTRNKKSFWTSVPTSVLSSPLS